MRRYLTTFLLGATLCLPVAAPLAVYAGGHGHDKRYYDAEHKDYHYWNAQEDRAWRHWLEVNHHAYHEWAKANRREQREYWAWRHDHPDWH